MENENKKGIKYSEKITRTQRSAKIAKLILGYLGYFGTLLFSAIQGFSTRYAVLPVYPYSKPREIGWLAPASFLAMYGAIGGLTIRHKPGNITQKRKNWKYMIFALGGLVVFGVSLMLGIKNTTIFSAGMDYGVYSNQKKSKIV